MRAAEEKRTTNETEISVKLTLDSEAPRGGGVVKTGCGFLDHMLTLFAFHSGFALEIQARGDTQVDYHHLTEDAGIVLGRCVKSAVGDGGGIARYASVFLPMDEALVLTALDLGGRAYLNYDVDIKPPKVGDFDTELVRDFLSAFCRSLGLTLHVKMFYGDNAHHIIEAVFKGLGRALGEAVKIDSQKNGGIPSSKGVF
jgi:imidazoleglycerol-phosphate dehydratase